MDREQHKRLAGKVLCMWCRKTIKQSVGIIQFPNGRQRYTHKKCLYEAEWFIYVTRDATIIRPTTIEELTGMEKKPAMQFLDDSEVR